MALKPVQDPRVLAALEGAAPAATPSKPVTDPALLAQLEGRQPSLDDQIPQQPKAPLQQDAPDGLWERVQGAFAGDPIIDMWLHGLKNTALGAPEVAADAIGNMGVMGAAGLSAPLLTSDVNDQAGFIKDFTDEHLMRPQTDAGKQLSAGIAEAFAPVEHGKEALGDAALEATGSPGAATAAYMAPDTLLTMLGLRGGVPGRGVEAPRTRLDVGRAGELADAPAANPNPPSVIRGEPKNPDEFDTMQRELAGAGEDLPKPDATVSPIVEDLRAADIRLRPSDVRAMHPGAKKIPGERREKFADAPDLKKDLNLHNQNRYTTMAGEELGLGEVGVEGLTEAQFAKAKEAPSATYNMVEDVLRDRPMSAAFEKTFREALDSIKLELPRGETNTILGTLGAIRKRAAKRLQSDNPEMEAKGYADRNMADALEEALGNELQAAGEPQLFEQYQAARQEFGKIHDIETATRAGQVDANVLYKLGQKKKLTGRLKLIADAAEHAPNVSQHSLKTAARAGDEVPGSREGIIKEGIKKLVRSIPGMDVGKAGFQEKLGRVDPTRTANYGREVDIPDLPDPQQGALDLREVLGLENAPGNVGAPARSLRDIGPQTDAFGMPFEFDAPPGITPRITLRPTSGPQSDAFAGMFDLAPPPGRTGVPSGASVAEDLGQVMIGDEPLAEPIQNFSAVSLADILGLREPLTKAPKKPKR